MTTIPARWPTKRPPRFKTDHEKRFEFELALRLHKSVDEMRRGMTRREFLWWAAYKQLMYEEWKERTNNGEKSVTRWDGSAW